MTRNAKTSPTCSERHRNRPPQLCLPNRVRSASCRAGAIRAERMRGRPVRAYPGASRGHAGAHCGAGPRCDDASRSRAVASRQSVRLTIRYRDHQAIKHLARAHGVVADGGGRLLSLRVVRCRPLGAYDRRVQSTAVGQQRSFADRRVRPESSCDPPHTEVNSLPVITLTRKR